MMGYLQDEDEPAELDFSKMEDLGKKLGTYCGQNPTHGVMRALDKVSDADDDSDALKSVVGVWTFGEKQVWIVVRPDGSATQCRIAPDGSVYFSKGAFRAPNILAWEKILGRRPGRPRERRDQTDGKIRVILLQAGRRRSSSGALCGTLRAPACLV